MSTKEEVDKDAQAEREQRAKNARKLLAKRKKDKAKAGVATPSSPNSTVGAVLTAPSARTSLSLDESARPELGIETGEKEAAPSETAPVLNGTGDPAALPVNQSPPTDSLANLQQTVSLLIAERSDLQARLAKLQAELSAAKGDSQLLEEGRGLMARLDEEKTALEERLSVAETGMENAKEVEKEVERLKEQLDKAEREKEGLRGVVEGLEKKYREMTEGEEGKAGELEKARVREGGLEAEIGRLRRSSTELSSNLAKATAELKAMSQSSSTTQTALAELQSAHAILQTSHDTLSTDQNALQSSYDGLQSTHSELKDSFSTSLSKIASLEHSLESTKTELASTKNDFSTASKRAESVEKRRAALQNENDDLVKQLEEMRGKVIEIMEEKVDMAARIESLEAKGKSWDNERRELMAGAEEAKYLHDQMTSLAEENRVLVEQMAEVETLKSNYGLREAELEASRTVISNHESTISTLQQIAATSTPLPTSPTRLPPAVDSSVQLELSAQASRIRSLEGSLHASTSRLHSLGIELGNLQASYASAQKELSVARGATGGLFLSPATDDDGSLATGRFGPLSHRRVDANLPASVRHSRQVSLSMLKARMEPSNHPSLGSPGRLPGMEEEDVRGSRPSASRATLLWGPTVSSGVYLKYYAATEPFASAPETKISFIGTTSLLFGYATGFPLIYFYNRYPSLIKESLWFGIALYTASMLGASFAKSVNALIVLQGIIPGGYCEYGLTFGRSLTLELGICGALCSFPFIRWIPEWFDKRKGLATGIIFSGVGVGGTVRQRLLFRGGTLILLPQFMPILYQYLVDRLGYQWSLRITAISSGLIAVGIVVLGVGTHDSQGTATLFINPRVPITKNPNRMPMAPFMQTFWRAGFFGCFLTTLLQGLGYFNVGLFLPRFSDTLNSSASAGLLSAYNVSCTLSQLLWGYASDKMRPANAMFLSSITGCVFAFTMWGFGGIVGVPLLAPFAICFGLAAGGFTSMWSQSASAMAGVDKEQSTLLFAGFSLARGLGAVIGPTIGATLYRASTSSRWGSAGSPGLVSLVASTSETHTAQHAAAQPAYIQQSPDDPASYVRDPHKLIAYLVPFPAPTLPTSVSPPPLRFVIYTPPPPPLMKPTEGEKEHLSHKVQRKWQNEVKEAKTTDAKVTSWKGIKGKVTKGISWAVDKTTSADLDFVTRIPKNGDDFHGDSSEGEETKRTVRLEEIVMIYPPTMNVSPDELKKSFIDSLMRTKSKAEKDAVIATGLLPVALCVDWALVDGVWAASSIKGAKTARSITKRLASSTNSGNLHAASPHETLALTFTPSPQVEPLQSYLTTQCAARDPQMFRGPNVPRTEADVLEAIGWSPSGQYEEKNWEDDAWERQQVLDDVKETMAKAAKSWDRWVKAYEKNPKKAANR
ncbi:hypothetical protein P7C73_g3947, partial [Tremellales sp. Uapishka_1]